MTRKADDPEWVSSKSDTGAAYMTRRADNPGWGSSQSNTGPAHTALKSVPRKTMKIIFFAFLPLCSQPLFYNFFQSYFQY